MKLSDALEFVEKVREAKKNFVIHTESQATACSAVDDLINEISESTNMFAIERLIEATREFLTILNILL